MGGNRLVGIEAWRGESRYERIATHRRFREWRQMQLEYRLERERPSIAFTRTAREWSNSPTTLRWTIVCLTEAAALGGEDNPLAVIRIGSVIVKTGAGQ